MSPKPKTMPMETAAAAPTTEYVCRRSLSAELRPYPGYSPNKERNPIQTATAKTPTTITVCEGKSFHVPQIFCSSYAASQTSTASKASDNNKTRTTPGCLQACTRRRLGSRGCCDGDSSACRAVLPILGT